MRKTISSIVKETKDWVDSQYQYHVMDGIDEPLDHNEFVDTLMREYFEEEHPRENGVYKDRFETVHYIYKYNKYTPINMPYGACLSSKYDYATYLCQLEDYEGEICIDWIRDLKGRLVLDAIFKSSEDIGAYFNNAPISFCSTPTNYCFKNVLIWEDISLNIHLTQVTKKNIHGLCSITEKYTEVYYGDDLMMTLQSHIDKLNEEQKQAILDEINNIHTD